MARSSTPAMKKNPQQSTPSTVVTETQTSADAGEESAGRESSQMEASIASSSREELIRQAAYRRFKERGTTHGDEVQDWLEAEAEINQSIVE